MSTNLSVEVSWSQPVSATVRFTVDEVRAAGVDVTDYEAVERWCEAEAQRLIRSGDVSAGEWDSNDIEIHECWCMNGDIDLDDMTPEERARAVSDDLD